MARFIAVQKWLSGAETDVFFALLRSALGTAMTADAEILSQLQGDKSTSSFSWDRLMFAFEKHALLGVVADVIMSLPQHQRPNMGIQMKMLQYVGRLAQTHHHFDQSVCTIFGALKSQGLHPVMLKGQGLATLYPKQHTRSCGDIDLFLHPEEFQRAARIIFDLCGDDGDTDIPESDELHHLASEYEGIHVELHYRPGTTIYDSNREEYEQWLAQEFRTTDDVLVNGQKIPVPHHHVNVIYVFCHLLRHFIDGGIGVRQFVDLLFLIQSQPIDEKALERDLRRFHLLESWQTIGGVLVHQLGMKAENFPLWNEKRARFLQGENLHFIIFGGNLGQQKTRHEIYTIYDRNSVLGFLSAIAYRWAEWRFYYLHLLKHLAPYENKHRAWKSLQFLINIAIKRICKLTRN